MKVDYLLNVPYFYSVEPRLPINYFIKGNKELSAEEWEQMYKKEYEKVKKLQEQLYRC